MKAEYIGGTHINYFIHCKRQLWYYLNKISLENNDEFVQIAKIKHDSHFNRNNIKEIQIGKIKIDIIDKICIREIKTSKIVKEEHIYQLKYYIYYLNKYCETNINKGIIHYVNISKKINIIYDSRDTSFIEDFIKGIINVSKQKFNVYDTLKNNKCKNCAFYDLCYI